MTGKPDLPGKGQTDDAGKRQEREKARNEEKAEEQEAIGKVVGAVSFVLAILGGVSIYEHRNTLIWVLTAGLAVLVPAGAVAFVRIRRRRGRERLQVVLVCAVVLVLIAWAALVIAARTGTPAASPATSPSAHASRPAPGQTPKPVPAPCAGAPALASETSPPAGPYATALPPDPDQVYGVAFSPDGKTLAVGTIYEDWSSGHPVNRTGGGLALWDTGCARAANATAPARVPGTGSQGVSNVVFNAAGTLLAATGGNDDTYLWNVSGQNPAPVAVFPDPPHMVLAGVAFGPDATLFTADVGSTVYQWMIPAAGSPVRAPVQTFQSCVTVYSIAVSPDDRTLAVGCADGTIKVWNIARHSLLTLPDPGSNGVTTLAFGGRDGTMLAAGGNNGETELWDMTGHRLSTTLGLGGSGEVTSVAFNPAGTILAAATADGGHGRIDLWSVPGGASLGSLQAGDNSAIFDVTFSPDGKTIAAGDFNSEALLWNATWLDRR